MLTVVDIRTKFVVSGVTTLLGNSVNRGTAHFLIWVLKSGGDCHFSVVQFNTMQHYAV